MQPIDVWSWNRGVLNDAGDVDGAAGVQVDLWRAEDGGDWNWKETIVHDIDDDDDDYDVRLNYAMTLLKCWAVVVVKWSACMHSTPTSEFESRCSL